MTRRYLLPLVAAVTVVALFVCASNSQAAEVPHHWHIKAIPHNPNGGSRPTDGAGPPAALYGISQAFVETPLGQPGNTADAELWPCFGGEGTVQPDCAFIGSTGTSDTASLSGSVVVGTDAYVWYLNADSTNAPLQPFGCNASTSADATNYCGQTNTWYEDWSGDTADELTYLLEATQNGSVVADSGTVDFGPNPYGTLSPVGDVIIYGDQNFGTLGQTGENNGNCEANYNYPIPAAQFAAITSITDSGTGTVTVTAANAFAVGDYVYITGTSNANYNGGLAIISAASGTGFQFVAVAGLGTATGGQGVLYYDGVSCGGGACYPRIVAAKKTCVDPVASASISAVIADQEVKLSSTTEIFKAAYTKSTSATTCGVGNTPCYTVKYTEVTPDKATQTWYIWMR
jgi:hypothetical protein